jgi:hypothetical protein
VPAGRFRRLTLDLALLLAAVAMLVLGPRFVEGRSALEWTRYYSARGTQLPKSADVGMRAGRAAARAIDRLAPLPQATEAARLALDFGRRLAGKNPAAAHTLFVELGAALERARTSGFGAGFDGLTAEAHQLEQQTESAGETGKP